MVAMFKVARIAAACRALVENSATTNSEELY